MTLKASGRNVSTPGAGKKAFGGTVHHYPLAETT